MENNEKKKRVRSPNYPVIPLDRAIEQAAALFRSQQRYAVSVEVAAKDWNISPKSSYLAQHVAAMSAYGLVDTEGEKESRKVKVSDLAFKIIIDKRPDSEERWVLTKESALSPYIFRKIYEQYPSGLPSDHALQYALLTDYKFNPEAVNDFMKILKETFDFANVYKSGIIGDKNKPIEEPEIMQSDKTGIQEVASARARGTLSTLISHDIASSEREIANYPIRPGLKARIIVTGGSPVTVDSIEKLMTLLGHNKEDLAEIIPDEKTEPIEN